MKKLLFGAGLAALMLLALANGRWEILLEPKIIVLYIMAVIASYYQPAYNPFELGPAKLDQGTALQIIWSIYISQFLALLEALHFNYPASMEFTPFAYAALSIAIAGLVLRTWAYLTLGRFFTWHVHVASEQKVITTGPYRFVRHPSYTGAFLTYVFNPLVLGSYISAAVAAALCLWAFQRRTDYEEKAMTRELGAEYENFCASRKKLFPGIW